MSTGRSSSSSLLGQRVLKAKHQRGMRAMMLKGQVAVVTGAGQGIGAAAAKALAEARATVVAVAPNKWRSG